MENVSIGQIAEAAEVAAQTVYNLIGGPDAICFAVISLVLDRLDREVTAGTAKGVARALDAANVAARLYVEDALLYRQVLVRIPQALYNGTHLGRDVAQISISAVREAQIKGEILKAVSADRLGRLVYTNFTGALYDWACGDSSDEDFTKAAQAAVLTTFASCSTDEFRSVLEEQVHAFLTA